MRTTKKVISAVLACCMLGSMASVAASAAVSNTDTTGSGYYPLDNKYTKALQNIDDNYRYNGDDLGATYTKEKTTFKVWSPTAQKIIVNLYATGSDTEEGAKKLGSYDMTKDSTTGVWSVELTGDYKNVYYTYTITSKSATSEIVTTKETQDVYSKAVGVNGNRSMVVDLDSTDPKGWENDKHVVPKDQTDSTVWEVHVKDFSYDKSSGVSEANRGKYLAFTETGTTLNGEEGNVSTCIDYLKDLGISTVQINPFYDFGSVNEAGDDTQFNWGYDPQNYNVPEGSFSSNPFDGNVRITECKQMIQALHDAGISVVMDVVYNHTFSTDSCFQATVPNYYYRLNSSGTFSNGSGCGNECATERAMYRNYVIQSCLYWVNEYHVDGFRFDLMGIMDVECMNQIRDALDKVDPKLTTWGEGWAGGDSYHPLNTCDGTKFIPANQLNSSSLSTKIAFFNDSIRDGIKGGALSIKNLGFVQGTKSLAPNIFYGLRANSAGTFKWSAQAPSQCVTYADCHDNATIYDQLVASYAFGDYGVRYDDAIAMNKMAGTIINMSQGVSFMLAGHEMARTKFGDTNSYKSSVEINSINWNNLVDYADLVAYYKGLFQIRSSFSPLTCDTSEYAKAFNINNSSTAYSKTMAYTITNDKENEFKKLAVLYSSDNTAATDITLKDTSVTEWVIIANSDYAGLEELGRVSGSTFTVPKRGIIIAVDAESYDALKKTSQMGKVKVSYIYDKTNTELAEPMYMQGAEGTAYQVGAKAAIPDTYVVSKVDGAEKGKYVAGKTQEIVYHYTDYVPERVANADFNQDGMYDVNDLTKLQLFLAGQTTLPEGLSADLNYDLIVDVNDVTMYQLHLASYSVSSGKVTVNHYYEKEDGIVDKITKSTTISGKVGDKYTTDSFKIVGYAPSEETFPENAEGYIPYGVEISIDYFYVKTATDITLHVKHNGSLTWAPTLWLWGADVTGKDNGYNYTDSNVWPGDTITDADGDGWYDKTFDCNGFGSYNVIVSNNASNQTMDYKGFVDNELWIVIDDSAIEGNSYLTFYTSNPDTDPNAKEAVTAF